MTEQIEKKSRNFEIFPLLKPLNQPFTKNKLFILNISFLFLLSVGCQAQTVKTDDRKERLTNILMIGDAMAESRAGHTATLLGNGKVLIAGGFSKGEKRLSAVEIYDSATGKFSSGDRMNAPRSGHTATLLPDGNVLIVGGFDGDYLDSAEIYDVKTGKFRPAAKMTVPRSEHVAVLLKNGKVLIAGGVGTGWTFLDSAEIYDPATGSFSKTGKMTTARESHTAVLLGDGQVLIAGGHQGRRSAMLIYASAELYDPQRGVFSRTADLTVKRHKHGAILLGDGRVLIVGGADERELRGIYKSVEVYDPQTKKFGLVGEMNRPRFKLQGTLVRLKNGKILISGSADRAEVFDPLTNSFELAEGKFDDLRLFSTATLLPNGQVLIAGGYDLRINVISTTWLYKF